MNDTKVNQASDAPKNETAPVEAKKPRSCGFCGYIGPTVLGVIQSNTLYDGDPADALKRPEVEIAVAKYPAIAKLIVPGNAMLDGKAKTKIKGEKLYEAYRAVTRKM